MYFPRLPNVPVPAVLSVCIVVTSRSTLLLSGSTRSAYSVVTYFNGSIVSSFALPCH
jgi:hypothetical protein